MILKGSKYCIFSGDLNRDGAIEGTDIALVDNAAFEFLTGYEVSDITGDGVIEGGDLSIIDNNSFSFIISVIP